MTDLVQFLTARYGEDEAWARNREERSKQFYRILKDASAQIGADTPPPSIARPQNNPANRALADIAAKRRIVALHSQAEKLVWDVPRRPDGPRKELAPWCADCQVEDGVIEGEWPCETLRLLAAPYRDHPDFDPDWAISD